METINYYTKADISLFDIAHYAIEHGYTVQWIKLPSQQQSIKLYLNIVFGTEDDAWCQWYEMAPNELWFDTQEDRERFIELQVQTILLFEYHISTIVNVVSFIKPLLIKFGGWIDCKGDALALYNHENLEDILKDCP